ncbi:MAG: gliding motility protein [Polyangiaceae bacterium]|nr:gliding motility protein [Polyangiaceae bacterium]
MPVLSPLARELVFKIVYYGPGLGGKTSTLRHIHSTTDPQYRGKMVSLATPVDRTLYFDFLPIRVPVRQRMGVRLQLFTVPGQVYYNATRKLVLTGADGIVFVADSQRARAEANLESIQNLQDNLAQHGRALGEVPHVIQYNKRDLRELVSMDELERTLNLYGVPSFATVATRGDGVYESLEAVTRAVLEEFARRTPEQSSTEERRFEIPEGGLAEALRHAEQDTRGHPMASEAHLAEEPNWQASRITLPGGLRPTATTRDPGMALAPPVPDGAPASVQAQLVSEAPPAPDAGSSETESEAAKADDEASAVVAGVRDAERPTASPVSGAGENQTTGAETAQGSSEEFDLGESLASAPQGQPRTESWGDSWRSTSVPPDAHEWQTGVSESAAFSFAELWPLEQRETVQLLEVALAQGDNEGVLRLAEQAAVRALTVVADLLEAPLDTPQEATTAVWSLGIDGRRYLEFRSLMLASRLTDRKPTHADALRAYVFVLDLQCAVNRLT